MTQLHPTRPALTGPTDSTGLSGPGIADLAALADLTGRSTIGPANLSPLTGPGDADLTEPDRASHVDDNGDIHPRGSLGALPGGSPVRETPSEPPPERHPTAHVNADLRPSRDRAD